MNKIALSMAMAILALAQTPQFEVASIRPATHDRSHDSGSDNGRYRTHNLSLKRLIAQAYEIDAREILGGPPWADSDGFDINAKIPEEFAQNRTHEKLLQMIRGLLADRFQLVFHREPRQVSGYLLVLAKKGSKMQPAKPDERDSSLRSNNSHLTAENVTMEAFAQQLSRDTQRLVVDKTGLAGGFNFELDWTPERLESSADDHPSLFTAVQERLGLKLESAKLPISAIVIDRAEKPQEN